MIMNIKHRSNGIFQNVCKLGFPNCLQLIVSWMGVILCVANCKSQKVLHQGYTNVLVQNVYTLLFTERVQLVCSRIFTAYNFQLSSTSKLQNVCNRAFPKWMHIISSQFIVHYSLPNNSCNMEYPKGKNMKRGACTPDLGYLYFQTF